MEVKIVHGNAADNTILDHNSVDLIVTSPPYNLGKEYGSNDNKDFGEYLTFTIEWLQSCYAWLKDTGRLCVNIAIDKNRGGKQPLGVYLTYLAIQVGFKYNTTVIWAEGNVSRRTAWGSWASASAPNVINPCELIVVLYKGDQWKRKRQGKNDITPEEFKEWVWGIWTFPGEAPCRVGHPAPFPRELPRRCIKLWSFEGDTILDPFCGSGTTLLEANLHNRIAIGIDIEAEYCDLTAKRIKNEKNKTNT